MNIPQKVEGEEGCLDYGRDSMNNHDKNNMSRGDKNDQQEVRELIKQNINICLIFM